MTNKLCLLLALAVPLAASTGWTGGAGAKRDPLADGLKIWRKPGAIDGGAACATCHSPDGIELAAYNFDDADLLRRAKPHLGDEAQLIVEYVHALRSKFHFTKLRDPDLDRPLQPGGTPLPGETAADRDVEFGNELKTKLPLLFGTRIETEAQAVAARDQLLKLDVTNLRVGFGLNRFSEDIAHGNEHASIAQWLPEAPPLIDAANRDKWYAAEDRYLANPTQAKLHNLLLLHGQFVNSNRMPGLGALSVLKYRGLLVWQDRLRNGTETSSLNLTGEVAFDGNYNPIWAVGDLARNLIGRDPKSIGMDTETQTKKVGAIPFAQQLHELRLGWFWAGWLSDQGLFKTSHDDKTRLGMWLSQSLSEDGPYPIHDVFCNARRQVVVSYDPESWGEPPIRKRLIWDFAGLRSFAYQTRDLPKDPDHRQLLLTLTNNCFRMNLLLLKQNIEQTHAVWVKISTKANMLELSRFLLDEDPASAATTKRLQEDLSKLIDSARERNQFSPK